MLTKLTNITDLKGKTIKDTESNMYGMVITFTDNTYALFAPTTNEDIKLVTGEFGLHLEVFELLKETPKIDANAVFKRFNKILERNGVMQKGKEISERYSTRKDLFSKAIEVGETLLGIEEIVNPQYKDSITRMLGDLKEAYGKISIDGELTGELAILCKQCFIIATHLFFYLEGTSE